MCGSGIYGSVGQPKASNAEVPDYRQFLCFSCVDQEINKR